MLLSGLLTDGTLATVALDAEGNLLNLPVVTEREEDLQEPRGFTLRGNNPNPFTRETTIQFDLAESGEVRVEVIDVMGRKVMETTDKPVSAGKNRSLRIDTSSLASGIYLYRVVVRMSTRTEIGTGHMILVK